MFMYTLQYKLVHPSFFVSFDISKHINLSLCTATPPLKKQSQKGHSSGEGAAIHRLTNTHTF